MFPVSDNKIYRVRDRDDTGNSSPMTLNFLTILVAVKIRIIASPIVTFQQMKIAGQIHLDQRRVVRQYIFSVLHYLTANQIHASIQLVDGRT